MQHLRAHGPQQAHLPVAHRGHADGILHQLRVGGHQPIHIRPVFIEARAQRRRHQRAADVRTAAGERAHAPFAVRAIKAGQDGVFQRLEAAQQAVIARLQFRPAVAQADDLRRVDEFPAQVFGQQDRA